MYIGTFLPKCRQSHISNEPESHKTLLLFFPILCLQWLGLNFVCVSETCLTTSGLHWLHPGCFLGRKTRGYCRPRLSRPSEMTYQCQNTHYCSPSAPPCLCLDLICLRDRQMGEKSKNSHTSTVKWQTIITCLHKQKTQCKYSKCVNTVHHVNNVSLTLITESLP